MTINTVQPLSFSNPAIKGFQCQFDLERYQDTDYTRLNVRRSDNHDKCVKKRKAEYLAGRHMAALALKELGIEHVDVTTGENRSPVWPYGIVGAISHNNATAMAVVARRSVISHIGLDIETLMKPQLADDIGHTIITEQEKQTLASLTGMPHHQSLTLAFSAKESIFKALYYDVTNYFGFNAAIVHDFNAEKQTITFLLNEDLTPRWTVGVPLTLGFEFTGDDVMTWLVIENGETN